MRTPRPDLAALGLVALCIVALVVLGLAHVPIPDVLTYVTVGALGVGGGTALNTATPTTTDAAAARIADSLGALEQLVGGSIRRASAPAPRSATVPAQPTASAPAPVAAA